MNRVVKKSRSLRLSLINYEKGSYWCHMSCALWSSLVAFEVSPNTLDIKLTMSNLDPSWWARPCCLCGIKMGVCIKCAEPTCPLHFHATCGYKHGLLMYVISKSDQTNGFDQYIAYCTEHSKIDPAACESLPSYGGNVAGNTTSAYDQSNERSHKFYRFIRLASTQKNLGIDKHLFRYIYDHWRNTRRTNGNLPLIKFNDCRLYRRTGTKVADNEEL
ncbi:hypothetical protein ACOME3_009464 [Neoechinorhynchus agilis]